MCKLCRHTHPPAPLAPCLPSILLASVPPQVAYTELLCALRFLAANPSPRPVRLQFVEACEAHVGRVSKVLSYLHMGVVTYRLLLLEAVPEVSVRGEGAWTNNADRCLLRAACCSNPANAVDHPVSHTPPRLPSQRPYYTERLQRDVE